MRAVQLSRRVCASGLRASASSLRQRVDCRTLMAGDKQPDWSSLAAGITAAGVCSAAAVAAMCEDAPEPPPSVYDIPIGKNSPDETICFIEVARGSRNKCPSVACQCTYLSTLNE